MRDTKTPTQPSALRAAALAAAALTAAFGLAAPAFAQSAETPAQGRGRTVTQSLNAAPADSVLSVDRVTAGPPLTAAERAPPSPPAPAATPRPAASLAPAPIVRPALRPATQSASTPRRARPQQLSAPDDAATRLLNQGRPSASVATPAGSGAPDIAAEPTPLIRGYYVRGDLNCDQVWPGEGNLAWLSDTSFTLDFGGCEAGQIQEVGPKTWREDQRCQTELGGDGGLYSIEYEQVAADAIVRRARLSLDGSVEEARWTLCRTDDVPEEARFRNAAAAARTD